MLDDMLVRSFKYHEFRMYEIHTCIWIFFLNLINLNYFVNSTFHFWRFHRIMTIFYMLLIQLSCGKTVEGCFCPVRERIYNICESLWEEKDVGQINLTRILAPLSLRQNLSRTDSFFAFFLFRIHQKEFLS